MLVCTASRGRIGGVETYLEAVLPALQQYGWDVGVLIEDSSSNGLEWRIPPGARVWAGTDLNEIDHWRPDIVYSHGCADPSLERALVTRYPSLFFAHSFNGMCATGAKTWARPVVRPCNKTFGISCVLSYYPHRCGGLNPVTFARNFRRQAQRNGLLNTYHCVVVASDYMSTEVAKHIRRPSRVVKLGLPLAVIPSTTADIDSFIQIRLAEYEEANRPIRLLYVGRLEVNKGCYVALNVAAQVASAVMRPVELTIVGEGSERHRMEAKATVSPDVAICFKGRLHGHSLATEMMRADLLLFPSVLPEPFGLVGLEAAYFGVPAVAFQSGGVSEWLHSGVSGAITKLEGISATALADAAMQCLQPSTSLRGLSLAARELAREWPSPSLHAVRLTEICDRIIERSRDEDSCRT